MRDELRPIQVIRPTPIRSVKGTIRIIGKSQADVLALANHIGLNLTSVKLGRGEEWLGYGELTCRVRG